MKRWKKENASHTQTHTHTYMHTHTCTHTRAHKNRYYVNSTHADNGETHKIGEKSQKRVGGGEEEGGGEESVEIERSEGAIECARAREQAREWESE